MTPKQMLIALKAACITDGVQFKISILDPDHHATEFFGHEGVEVWLGWVESSIKGKGAAFLRKLTEKADELDIVLRLDCEDDGSNKLLALYKQFGFYSDYAGSTIMERVPPSARARQHQQFMVGSVITEDGCPGGIARSVYHGTLDVFSKFNVSARGSFGRGIYFASSIQQADMYGGEDPDTIIMEVNLAMKNPYHYKIREPEVVDIWGEGIIVDLYGDQALAILNAALENGADPNFGDEIHDRLIEWGHDGIIATFSDGSQELVVFDSTQVFLKESHLNIEELLKNQERSFRQSL